MELEEKAREHARRVVNQPHYWDKRSLLDKLAVSRNDLETDIAAEILKAMQDVLSRAGEE